MRIIDGGGGRAGGPYRMHEAFIVPTIFMMSIFAVLTLRLDRKRSESLVLTYELNAANIVWAECALMPSTLEAYGPDDNGI